MSATVEAAPAANKKQTGTPGSEPNSQMGEKKSFWQDPVVRLILFGILFQLGAVAYFYLNFDPAIARLMPDDSFYYLKTARNIRLGLGSCFSPGQPTNGYHPLWMALLVVDQVIFQPGIREGVLHSLLLGVLGNAVAAFILRQLLRELNCTPAQQGIGVALYLITPWFLNMSICGEGVQLYFLALFLFFLAAHRVIREPQASLKTYLFFGAASGIVMLARTDAIFFTGPAFLYLFVRARARNFVPLAAAGAAAVVVLSPWLIWSYARFGTIIQSSSDALAMVVRAQVLAQCPPEMPMLSRFYRGYAITNAFYVLNRLFFAVFTRPATFGWNTGRPEQLMVLGVIAATGLPILYHLFKRKSYQGLPFIFWGVPALLMSAYYLGYRFYVQVWHLAPLLVAMLIGITLILRVRTFPPVAAAAGLLALVGLTGYSLTSCYFFPQQRANAIYNSIHDEENSPRPLKKGSLDSGYLGYFSKHEVVNLDGVINNKVLPYIKAGRFSDYIESENFDRVSVTRDRLEFYDRNRGGTHAPVITLRD